MALVTRRPVRNQGFISHGAHLAVTVAVAIEVILKILEANSALGSFKEERGKS